MRAKFWIDTSFWYALFVRADANNAAAGNLWQSSVRLRPFFITSNLIVAERGSLLSYRFGHGTAFRQLSFLYDSSIVSIAYSDREIEIGALRWWERFSVQRFSHVDCVSFEFIRRLGISTAFSYDRDFTIAGFQLKKE